MNANLDMIVSAKDLLQALQVNPTKPVNHQTLSSVEDLEQVVSYSMLHCAAMERTFINADSFYNIVHVATALSHKVKTKLTPFFFFCYKYYN